MNHKDYDKYLLERKFSVNAIEVLQNLPNEREIDGVKMIFNEKELSFELIFEKKSAYLAINIFEIILGDVNWVNLKLILYLNNILIYDKKLPAYDSIFEKQNEKIIETLNFKNYAQIITEIIENIFFKINEFNKLKIIFSDKNIFYYVNGIVIYKNYIGQKNEDYYLNKQLDAWKKDKLI